MEEEGYERSIFQEEEIPVVYATFWERLGALVLDWLILLPLTILNRYNSTNWRSTSFMVIATLLALAYKPLFEYLNSATPGKKGLSITIINKTYGKPDLQEILLRNIFHIGLGLVSLVSSALLLSSNIQFSDSRLFAGFGHLNSRVIYTGIISFILGLVYITDVIVFFADKENRSLHDMIGKTYVIKKYR